MRASLLLGALVLGAPADAVWTFDTDPPGRAPAAFTYRVTRDAAPARWLVQREATNGFLVHAGEPSAKGGFSLAILEDQARSPVSLSARMRLAGPNGELGIAWRVQDANNYYLARLDVEGGEQDIALYRIVNGNRVRVDGEDDLELDRAAWHTIKVVQEDDTIRVYLGGIRVLRARDRTFARPGGVALWCTGEAVAHFDDLRVGQERESADARSGRGR
jgi:hypothetical protein